MRMARLTYLLLIHSRHGSERSPTQQAVAVWKSIIRRSLDGLR
jgi:hypothetical protein